MLSWSMTSLHASPLEAYQTKCTFFNSSSNAEVVAKSSAFSHDMRYFDLVYEHVLKIKRLYLVRFYTKWKYMYHEYCESFVPIKIIQCKQEDRSIPD